MATDPDLDLSRLRQLLAGQPPQPDTDPDPDTRPPTQQLRGLPRLLSTHTGRTVLLPQLLAHLHLPLDLLATHPKLDAWRTIHNAVVRAGYDPITWLPLATAPPAPRDRPDVPRPTRAGHDRAMAIARRHLTTNDDLWWDSMPSGTTRDAVWQTVHRLRAGGWQIVTRYGLGYSVEARGT